MSLFFSSISSLQSLFFCMGNRYDAFAPCKGMQGTVGLWILRDCGRTTYDTIHLMYASVMRHTHEPNSLLTYYAVLRPFQSCSFPGTITGGVLNYE